MHYSKSKQPTKKKTNADMRVIAHQKAPLDYISPWEAQHQQLYLAQSQNIDNLQVKQKSQDKGHNVVNSFLEKIRKTHSLYRRNKLSKNFSAQEKEKDREREDLLLAANGGRGFNGGKGGISRIQSGIDGSAAEKDIVTNMSDSRAAQDFGFGRMHYAKNDISNHQTQLIKRASTQLGNSYTISRKLNKTQTEPHYDSFNPSLLNPNYEFLPPQHRTRTLINSNTHTSKLFSRQDLSNPKQIVFIKKKKNKKNITIVDINSTAQEFYEEQIRYAEQKMVQKYRRLKNRDQCRVVRCETQGGGRKMEGGRRKSGGEGEGKGEFSDRRVEFPFNKEELKKRYCFMEELKDQTIAVRIQNIMRCHPSLANTLLITK